MILERKTEAYTATTGFPACQYVFITQASPFDDSRWGYSNYIACWTIRLQNGAADAMQLVIHTLYSDACLEVHGIDANGPLLAKQKIKMKNHFQN